MTKRFGFKLSAGEKKLISRLSHLMEKQMSSDFDETENVSFFPTERGKLLQSHSIKTNFNLI